MSRLTESEEENQFKIGEIYTPEEMERGLMRINIRIEREGDGRKFLVYKNKKDEDTLRYLFEHQTGNKYLLHDICEKSRAYIFAYIERGGDK